MCCERHDQRPQYRDRDREATHRRPFAAPSPPSHAPETNTDNASGHPQRVDQRQLPGGPVFGIVDELPAVADGVAEAAALYRVEPETDVGGVVPGGGGERVARRDAAQRAAQPQVRLVEGRALRGHVVAQCQVSVIDGQHHDPGAVLVENRDQGGCAVGRLRRRERGDLEPSPCLPGAHIDDGAVVVPEAPKVRIQDDVVGQGWGGLP